MEEKIRIESLNARGLRDGTKRCDIPDKAKLRNTDIMFIQETHWTMTDYTKIREDWNIEIFIAGNSSSARGTAILLNKTFEYKIHNPIVDANGRYVILDIDIALLGRITLGSIYAPNEQIEHFIDELFEKINTLNNVFHIIGGDWNMIQNFKLDTYNYEKWNNKKASEHLGKEKTEFELVDIWRTKNRNTTRFSWWKKNTKKSRQIRLFFSNRTTNIHSGES